MSERKEHFLGGEPIALLSVQRCTKDILTEIRLETHMPLYAVVARIAAIAHAEMLRNKEMGHPALPGLFQEENEEAVEEQYKTGFLAK